MIVQKVEVTAEAEVRCIHPDDNSRYYTYSIGFETYEIFVSDAEEARQYAEIRSTIEKQVNPYGYWHEVEIALVWYLENNEGEIKKFKKKI